MVQLSMIFLLGTVVVLFVMVLKLHITVREFLDKVEEIDTRVVKLDSAFKRLEDRQSYFESNLRMIAGRLKHKGE